MSGWDNSTGRRVGDGIDGIARGKIRRGCAGRARRHPAGRASNQVRLEVGFVRNGIARLFVFQSPLLFDAINLSKVIDARFNLRRFPGLHEIGNGYDRQQPDDGHHDHYFHQREAASRA